jgi:hypothetical protein
MAKVRFYADEHIPKAVIRAFANVVLTCSASPMLP